MKKLFLILLISVSCFAQTQYEIVAFSDTTTSALIDRPNSAFYLAGIAKPDSGGDIITFDIETSASGTNQYDLLTQVADSSYTITLPDSTSAYSVTLPKDVFEAWNYFRVKFAKATTCSLTVIWKHK